MISPETFTALRTWTPYLLEGFGWNILIAFFAMTIGTTVGAALAWMRLSRWQAANRTSLALTELGRNVPTIVFQFYLAVMLPGEWTVPGTAWLVTIPVWFKAALALAVAVVGFTSDNLYIAAREWRDGRHAAAMIFVPSWASYLLVIVIASSTASIIGVNEIVSRCNTVVNATGDSALLIPVYLYASLFFLVFCLPLTLLMKRVKLAMTQALVPRSG